MNLYYSFMQNRMSHRAMVLGIGSIVLAFMYMPYFSVPLAFFAILFGLLSRGYSSTPSKEAKIGLISAVMGIVIAVAITYKAFTAFVTDTEYRNNVLEAAELMYGETYQEMYGIDLSDTIDAWIAERSK